MAEPNGKGSPAMEARRTKFKDGQIEELDGPTDTRAANRRRESPHAAACRAIDAARRDNDASDPLTTAPASGPPECTGCKRRKLPIGVASQGEPGSYCDETCYAYRWSPTPPTAAAFVPYPAKQEGGKAP